MNHTPKEEYAGTYVRLANWEFFREREQEGSDVPGKNWWVNVVNCGRPVTSKDTQAEQNTALAKGNPSVPHYLLG